MRTTTNFSVIRWMKGAALTLLLISFGCGVAAGKEADDSKEDKQAATEDDIKSFDVVWETIRDSHWDLDENLWNKAKADLREKAQSAKTRDEVRELIGEMLGRLGQSHFGLIPAEAYEVLDGLDDEEGGEEKTGELGFDVRLIEGEIVVTNVTGDSAASKAGIQPGWKLTRLKKRSSEEVLSATRKATASGPIRLDTAIALRMYRALQGPTGSKVKIELEDNDGEKHQFNLQHEAGAGSMAKLGNLPKMRVTHDTKQLDGDVAYFTFNMFFDPARVVGAYLKAVEQAREGNGLIIDLRGNLGGIGGMTFRMVSAFVDERGEIGVMKTRETELKFPVFPQPDPYHGPVAVLIDECSLSSAEIMAGGLQDLKLARLFGSTTGGLALPSTIVKLPNGDGFQYAFATYTSASGKTLEGEGVTPDESVKLTREKLKSGADPALDRALEWVKSQ